MEAKGAKLESKKKCKSFANSHRKAKSSCWTTIPIKMFFASNRRCHMLHRYEILWLGKA